VPDNAEDSHRSADSAGSLSPKRVGLGLLVAAMLGFWAWIFVAAPRDNPDRFADPAFALAAEPLCAAAQTRIDALPPGHTAATPAERAMTVRAGTELTGEMVAGLRNLAAEIPAGRQAETLAAWLDDWDVYIADRWAHVERLESADADTECGEIPVARLSGITAVGHGCAQRDSAGGIWPGVMTQARLAPRRLGCQGQGRRLRGTGG